jgi:hypothetical protein
VQVLWELENKAGTGSDEGLYYEVGIAPSFPSRTAHRHPADHRRLRSNDFYGSLDTVAA